MLERIRTWHHLRKMRRLCRAAHRDRADREWREYRREFLAMLWRAKLDAR